MVIGSVRFSRILRLGCLHGTDGESGGSGHDLFQ